VAWTTEITAQMPASVAVARLLLRLLDTLEQNVDGVLRDIDTEFLHDLRVAVRRTRSAIKLLGDALPAGLAAPYAAEFKWLGDLTTPTRDLDVHLLGFGAMTEQLLAASPADLEPFRAFLVRRRAREFRRLAAGLRSARFKALTDDWRKALLEVRDAAGRKPGAAAPTAADLAVSRTGRAFRRVAAQGAAITPDSAPDPCTTCVNAARSCATCWSSSPRCTPRSRTGRSSVTSSSCRTASASSRTARCSARRSGAGRRDAGRARRPGRLRCWPWAKSPRLAVSQAEARADFAQRFARFAGPAGQHRIRACSSQARHRTPVKIYATYNIKGGVGKTTAAVNLAYLSAADGQRTLLWDLDPQGAASFLFRIKPRVKGGGKALIRGTKALDDAIKGTDFDNLDLLPADFTYRNMDLLLGTDRAAEANPQARQLLRPLAAEYDNVFLDCPPSISLVSENVMHAADVLLVPLIPTTLSVRTLDQLTEFVAGFDGDRPEVRAFFSMVDRRKRLHQEITRRPFPRLAERSGVTAAAIPASCPSSSGCPWSAGPGHRGFAPRSQAARAFRALWFRKGRGAGQPDRGGQQ
jgi:chromosome partitioning protein